MNEFTRLEALWASFLTKQHRALPYTPDQLKTAALVAAEHYAQPQDQEAAAVALLQLVAELLTQEKPHYE